MYKVKVLKDEIKWLKKGEITELDNMRSVSFERKGIVKILGFAGNHPFSKGCLKSSIRSMECDIQKLKHKILLYKRMLGHGKKSE